MPVTGFPLWLCCDSESCFAESCGALEPCETFQSYVALGGCGILETCGTHIACGAFKGCGVLGGCAAFETCGAL